MVWCGTGFREVAQLLRQHSTMVVVNLVLVYSLCFQSVTAFYTNSDNKVSHKKTATKLAMWHSKKQYQRCLDGFRVIRGEPLDACTRFKTTRATFKTLRQQLTFLQYIVRDRKIEMNQNAKDAKDKMMLKMLNNIV